MQLDEIPKSEQKDFIASFWSMLRECETKADNDNDPLLKRWVESYYMQWNRITGAESRPIWIARKDKA